MSRGVLLLTYIGRRSGRRYTLPVQYVRADHGLILWPAHHDRKRWWRNLQPPAPVQLRVAGRELHGTAQVLANPYGHQAMRDRETALALGTRVVVAASCENDPNPVMWLAGQDYRAANAARTARLQQIRPRHGQQRLAPER